MEAATAAEAGQLQHGRSSGEAEGKQQVSFVNRDVKLARPLHYSNKTVFCYMKTMYQCWQWIAWPLGSTTLRNST